MNEQDVLLAGLVSSGGEETDRFIALLERQRVEFVFNISPSDITPDRIADSSLHIWLLDIEEDDWGDALDDLLDQAPVPVFFHERGSISKQTHPEFWARKQVERLFEMAGLEFNERPEQKTVSAPPSELDNESKESIERLEKATEALSETLTSLASKSEPPVSDDIIEPIVDLMETMSEDSELDHLDQFSEPDFDQPLDPDSDLTFEEPIAASSGAEDPPEQALDNHSDDQWLGEIDGDLSDFETKMDDFLRPGSKMDEADEAFTSIEETFDDPSDSELESFTATDDLFEPEETNILANQAGSSFEQSRSDEASEEDNFSFKLDEEAAFGTSEPLTEVETNFSDDGVAEDNDPDADIEIEEGFEFKLDADIPVLQALKASSNKIPPSDYQGIEFSLDEENESETLLQELPFEDNVEPSLEDNIASNQEQRLPSLEELSSDDIPQLQALSEEDELDFSAFDNLELPDQKDDPAFDLNELSETETFLQPTTDPDQEIDFETGSKTRTEPSISFEESSDSEVFDLSAPEDSNFKMDESDASSQIQPEEQLLIDGYEVSDETDWEIEDDLLSEPIESGDEFSSHTEIDGLDDSLVVPGDTRSDGSEEALDVDVPFLDDTAACMQFEEVAAEPAPPNQNLWVLGASLGGPAAVKRFLQSIPATLDAAFILGQHIDENFLPVLCNILDTQTGFRAVIVDQKMKIQSGYVYVAPIKCQLTFDHQGYVDVSVQSWTPPYAPCIDDLVKSAGDVYQHHCGVLIFSGMGEDGLKGVRHVKDKGVTVWTQSSETCANSSMPDSVASVGLSDYIGSPEEMAAQLHDFLQTRKVSGMGKHH